MVSSSSYYEPLDKHHIYLGQLLEISDEELVLEYGDIAKFINTMGIHRNTLTTLWSRHINV